MGSLRVSLNLVMQPMLLRLSLYLVTLVCYFWRLCHIPPILGILSPGQSSPSASSSSAFLTQPIASPIWIIDSGADHMSVNMNHLFNAQNSTLTDGSQSLIYDIGLAHPNIVFLFTMFCLCLLFLYSLISGYKLIQQINCVVAFFGSSVYVQDCKTGEMIGAKYESKGVYILTGLSPAILTNMYSHPVGTS